jgi:hypothetical protein
MRAVNRCSREPKVTANDDALHGVYASREYGFAWYSRALRGP